MYVLGIDGGGTKTIGVIADEQGQIIAKHSVGASNPNSVDREIVKQELTALIQTLSEMTGDSFSSLKAVFAGMSGVGSEENREWMEAVLRELLPSSTRLKVDIDGVNALYAGTLGKPGIVNIAGTGSLTFGINHQGHRDRVGGWGYLLDEAGSGYEIGRQGIVAVFHEWDGTGEQTTLTKKIVENMSVSAPNELIPIIYEAGQARKVIAPLSQLVMEAADEGDLVSKNILSQAASKMAENISALLMKLFDKKHVHEPVPIVLAGGVFHRADFFIPTIEQKLSHHPVKSNVIVPSITPVAGALAGAWLLVGNEVDEAMMNAWINAGI